MFAQLIRLPAASFRRGWQTPQRKTECPFFCLHPWGSLFLGILSSKSQTFSQPPTPASQPSGTTALCHESIPLRGESARAFREKTRERALTAVCFLPPGNPNPSGTDCTSCSSVPPHCCCIYYTKLSSFFFFFWPEGYFNTSHSAIVQYSLLKGPSFLSKQSLNSVTNEAGCCSG